MLIAAAHKNNILVVQPQVPYINIGRNVCPRQVPDMFWTIGIGKRRRDSISFEVLHSIISRRPVRRSVSRRRISQIYAELIGANLRNSSNKIEAWKIKSSFLQLALLYA